MPVQVFDYQPNEHEQIHENIISQRSFKVAALEPTKNDKITGV